MVIIAKVIFNEVGRRSIIKDVEYTEEAFPDYAIIPEELVKGILATEGFCDIELTENGREVVSFTAREIPAEPKPEQDYKARIASLEEELAAAKILLGVE